MHLHSSISANTRVIKQSSLQKFQEEMGAVQKDPYRVVMKQSKLPMSLLHDRVKAHVSVQCLPQNDSVAAIMQPGKNY